MSTTVNVLCPNGRRVNVKVAPSTTLLQVLEEVCEKQKFDPVLHTLKHHKKILDLSSLFRYANLPQNAKLEMVPTETPRTESTEVVLAVQCEDGRRVQGKFDPSSTSLWGVLTKLGLCEFEGGRLEPVVAYTNNQICGETALQKTTLKGLGLTSGRAVLRLLFRERRTPLPQLSQSTDALPSQKDTSEVTTDSESKEPSSVDENCRVNTGLPLDDSQSKPTDSVSTDEPMETQSATDSAEPDDEHPKSKLSSRPRDSHATPKQFSISTNQTTASTMREAPSDEELPYFPAHPISYFPQETESSASASTSARRPHQTGPTSMFDKLFSLYTVSEDELPLQPSLEFFQFPPTTALAQSRRLPQSPPKVYDEPCDREQVVFHLDTSLSSPSVEVPDEFFNVTMQDVQLIHEDHKKQLEVLSDAPLMTQNMKMAKIQRKYESYDKAVVRVHFPDRWVLQGCFRPRESLKSLVRFIRDNLADPQIKFHLYTTPPKVILKSGRVTFLEAGFVPAAIVHVGVDSRDAPQPSLSPDCLKQARSGMEAEIVVAKKRELKHDCPSSTSSLSRSKSQSSSSASTGGSASGKSGATATVTSGSSGGAWTGEARKVPKWFKMGK